MEFYEDKILQHYGKVPDMVADRYGDKTAFIFRDQSQSFNELSKRSTKLASALIKEGLEPGEIVVLYIPNSIQFPESYFGIIKAGCIPLPLNLRIPPRTLSYAIDDSGAKTMIGSSLETSYSGPDEVKKLKKDSKIDFLIMQGESGEDSINYSQFIQRGNSNLDYPTRSLEDTATLLYTSGTTGKPKGVPITQENLLANTESQRRVLGLEPTDRFLSIFPFYHAGGLFDAMGIGVCDGVTHITQAEADPKRCLKNIEKYECNYYLAPPVGFRMVWLEYASNPEDYDVSSVKFLISGGGPLDKTTQRNFEKEWEAEFSNGWGMTETTSTAICSYGTRQQFAINVGRPNPLTEVKIVDPDTRETLVPWDSIAPWGELEEEYIDIEGELAIRGSLVFKGYWKMPEKNKQVFDEDGWFYTGDLMRVDENKRFWPTGRIDDLIVSGGEKIYPTEVEDALMEHPKIMEAGVVAAPHKTKGKAPVAFVVTGPDADLTEQKIKEFALDRVPTYAHPRRVFFKDGLPKSGVLKTQHFKLEEEAKELLSEPLG